MSILSKDAYYNRQQYANKKNMQNSEIAIENGMTEEQAEVITDLCRIRHYLHCNSDKLFHSYGSEYWTIIDYIDGGISDILKGVKLPNKGMSWNYENLLQEHDYDDDITEEDYEDERDYEDARTKAYQEAYKACHDFMVKVNKDIELYLRNIDKQYKTKFEPTGSTRL